MIKIEGLDRCQSVCPKCSNSYVSVYNLVDNELIIRLVMGFCHKCNTEWVIANTVVLY